MGIIEKLIEQIKKDLRQGKHTESIYATSKASGLRADVINAIEDKNVRGKAVSLAAYIDSYCKRFPETAYILFYNAASEVAQGQIIK